MMDRESTIKAMARFIGKACEMHDGEDGCIERRDCAKCSVATEPAEELYDAGYRYEGDGENEG